MFSHTRLLWTAEWSSALRPTRPLWSAWPVRSTFSRSTALWGEGDTSSSDGQFFRTGGHGEERADHNAHYGSEPDTKFCTHVSDRFAPFCTKVIAANASEAAHGAGWPPSP